MTRFEPGDTVSFTYQGEEEHWIIGDVEEIRKGHEGNHLLVVRQGGPWSGSRYIVLSSYAEKVEKGNHDTTTSRHVDWVSLYQALNMDKAIQGNRTAFLN